MAVDDSYTKLLLHCNGDDESQNFIDESGKTVTVYGSTQIDTAIKKLGNGAGLFDGTGDYLKLDDSADWDFGTGDWTIDFWIYRSGTGNTYQGIVLGLDASNQGWKIVMESGKVGIDLGATRKLTQTHAISLTTWTHIAVVRNGNTITIYKDGVADGNYDCTGDNYDSGGLQLTIGRFYPATDDYYFLGSFDEMRLSKGIARWTSNFTPPTSEYTGILKKTIKGLAYASVKTCKGLAIASVKTKKGLA